MSKSHLSALASAFVPLTFYVVILQVIWDFDVDDAYISMRYAKNLADGYGLKFNTNGMAIEGYSNFLLVVLEAILDRFGVLTIDTVKWLNVVAGCALVLTIHYYARAVADSDLVAFAASMLLVTSAPILFWTVGGLETSLFVATLLVGVVSGLRSRVGWSQTFFVACALLRPEGAVYWLISSWWGWRNLRSGKTPILIAATLLLAYHGWRVWYFEQILPSSFVAKNPGLHPEVLIGGLWRLISWLALNQNVIIVAFVITAVRRENRFTLAGLLTCAHIMLVVAIGARTSMDDIWRFFVPLTPLYLIMAVDVANRFPRWITPRAIFTLVAIFLTLRVYEGYNIWFNDMNVGSKGYTTGARDVATGLDTGHVAMGRWLAERYDPTKTVLLHDAGAIPYFSQMTTIDAWSLTEPNIIELKKQHKPDAIREYIKSFRPDVIVQDNWGVLSDPVFSDSYRKLDVSFTYLEAARTRRGIRNYRLEAWERVKNPPLRRDSLQ